MEIATAESSVTLFDPPDSFPFKYYMEKLSQPALLCVGVCVCVCERVHLQPSYTTYLHGVYSNGFFSGVREVVEVIHIYTVVA